MTVMPKPIVAYDVAADGRATPLADLRTTPQDAGGYVWLHFERGDPALEDWLMEALPSVVAQSLVQAETRPRSDPYGDGLIVNLRGVNLNAGSDREDMVSLRLWISPSLLVTVRQRKVFSLDAIRQEIAATGHAPLGTGMFLATLSAGITDRVEQISMDQEDSAAEAEEKAYDPDTSGVPDLPFQRRRVIRLRRYLTPQRDALTKLAAYELPFLTPDCRNALRECANRTARAVEELDAARDRLNVVQDHLDTLQAARIGRNSYVLSIVAAIFLPLGFLTGLFGMNVAGLPGTHWTGAFATVTVLMAAVGVGLYLLFRALRWF